MFGLGVSELIIICAVIFLLFGANLSKRFFSNAAKTISAAKESAREVKSAWEEK